VSKSRVGSGLDALLGAIAESENSPAGAADEIRIDLIAPNPHQPRRHFDEESLKGLAQSIKENGVLQPILLEKNGSNSYRIIAGERRYRASRIAGLSTIPAIVRDFSDEERMEIALLENIQREDLRPIEEAQAYSELMHLLGLNQQELADRLGKSRSAVANSLRLLKLPRLLQEATDNNIISAGHARALLAVSNPVVQKELYDEIVAQGLSVRQTENLAAGLYKAGAAAKNPAAGGVSSAKRQPAQTELETALTERFGTKVVMKGSERQGKIEISYYSEEDLERLLTLLGFSN
jgi:ParB family chromosome partitioning protein